MVLGDDPAADVEEYATSYREYFERNTTEGLTCLDPAPRWAVWPGRGTICFGRNPKEARIVADIKDHTIRAIQVAEALGGWTALPEKDVFEVEYWVLEQAKLGRSGSPPLLAGKIALVTGAASGIGLACASELQRLGAVVGALDVNPEIVELMDSEIGLGIECDVVDDRALGGRREGRGTAVRGARHRHRQRGRLPEEPRSSRESRPRPGTTAWP